MNRFKLVVVLAMACVLVATFAYAENMKLSGTVTDKVDALDKNGKPYLRIILQHESELDGVKFMDSSVCVAFDANIAKFADVQIGDEITVIGDYRKLPDGRVSYTLKSLL